MLTVKCCHFGEKDGETLYYPAEHVDVRMPKDGILKLRFFDHANKTSALDLPRSEWAVFILNAAGRTIDSYQMLVRKPDPASEAQA